MPMRSSMKDILAYEPIERRSPAWDIYFSTLVGWSLHPGYLKEGTEKITLEECAKMADKMIRIREK